jgi:protein SCO1/2
MKNVRLTHFDSTQGRETQGRETQGRETQGRETQGRDWCGRLFRGILVLALALAVAGSGAADALAQKSGTTRKEFEGVGVTRHLGEKIPTDLTFKNADGEAVELSQYFDGETPVVLNLVYHDCPMLCGLMLSGITKTMDKLSWTPGQEYRVLTVSFNHRETPDVARKNKDTYVRRLGRPAAASGWHFLTGNQASIEALTGAVGFNFRWIEDEQEYAHPTTVIFLDGEGTVTRYIYGMELPKGDFRKALVEASNGNVGNPVDQIAMYCFQFDPNKNTYTANAFNIMKLGSGLTVLLLGAALFFFWRRENDDLAEAEQAADEAMREALGDDRSSARPERRSTDRSQGRVSDSA